MTPNQLKKIAQLEFVDEMAKLGFELGPNRFWFYRKRDWLVDIVTFGTTGGGSCLSASIEVWVPEMNVDYDASKFPEGYYDECAGITAGTWMGPAGVFIGAGSWDVEDKDQVPSVFNEVLSVFKSDGLEWLDDVSDVDSLIDVIDEDLLAYDDIVERINASY